MGRLVTSVVCWVENANSKPTILSEVPTGLNTSTAQLEYKLGLSY